MGTIELVQDPAGIYRFRLRVSGGQVVAVSGAHAHKSEALRAIGQLQAEAAGAGVEDLTEPTTE